MAQKYTLVDRIINKIKNNKLLAGIILFGLIVVSLSTFTDALRNILGSIPKFNIKPNLGISGIWIAEKKNVIPYTIFTFKFSDNKLYGSVKPPGYPSKQRECGIIDGVVTNESISFRTKHDYVVNRGEYDSQALSEVITIYKGKIKGNKINFIRQSDKGGYAEFTAEKVIDKTTVNESGKYVFLYTLPGHEGGISSISFGPDDARFPNGGLRFMSGGLKDCTYKAWNLADAKEVGAKTGCERHELKGGAAIVAYKPERNNSGGISYMDILPYSKNELFFHRWNMYDNYSSGGGGKPTLENELAYLKISNDTDYIVTAESQHNDKFLINVRNDHGKVIKSFNIDGQTTAIAIDGNGNFAAAGSINKLDQNILYSWSLKDSDEDWEAISDHRIDVLAFNPNGELLAIGSVASNNLVVRRKFNGTLLLNVKIEPIAGISHALFSNDGEYLIVANSDSSEIAILDVKNLFKVFQVIDTEVSVGALAISGDNRLLAVGDKLQGKIKLWGKK